MNTDKPRLVTALQSAPLRMARNCRATPRGGHDQIGITQAFQFTSSFDDLDPPAFNRRNRADAVRHPPKWGLNGAGFSGCN